MQIIKLKVLTEAEAVRDAKVIYDAIEAGWMVQVTYTTRSGERIELLKRQRGGVRVFATLDAVARNLAGLGLPAFRVDATGLAGQESP